MRDDAEGLTKGESLYLKELYRMESEGTKRITSVSLAMRFSIRPASVVDMFSKLERKKLLNRRSWRPVKLSRKGAEVAEGLIWRHRILETYFVSILELSPTEACKAATDIDALIPETVVTAMCAILHHPSRCVHGYIIPHPKGRSSK